MRAHVHPSFSLKGNYICYTSDRSGVSQVYVVPVGDITSGSSGVTQTDDFESGQLADFWRPGGAGHGRYVPEAVSITDQYRRSGESCVRLTTEEGAIIQDGGDGNFTERAELDSGKHPFLNNQVWYKYSLLIPEHFPVIDTRLVISQIKQSGVSVGPLVAQRFRNGRHYLTVRELSGRSKKQIKFELPELTTERWHDFAIQVYFSEEKDGIVNFWMDGKQVVSFHGKTAHKRGKNEFYHKMGMYRDQVDVPMTIYFDDYLLTNEKNQSN